MAEGRKDIGSQTFDQHLTDLLESEQITAETNRTALAATGAPLPGPRRTKRAASSWSSSLAQPPALADIISQILSVPREAGTPAAEHARRAVSEHLQGLGYEVEVQRFSFSPASLNGYPLLGAGLGGLALLLFPLLASGSLSSWWAVGVWFTGLASLISVAAGVGRAGLRSEEFGRTRTC